MGYLVQYLEEVKIFISSLPESEQAKIKADIDTSCSGDFKAIYIKTLKSPIKELIVKKYRIFFFIYKNNIYFIRAFIKKTAKTPKREIENAEKIYKAIISII
jgi:phage-related protein